MGVRTRTKEREKQCAFCDRTFTKEEHLKRHERSHTGERPFKCHKCNRKYARSDVLARHLQTHPFHDVVAPPQPSVAETWPQGSTDLGEQAALAYEINQPSQGTTFPPGSQQLDMPDADQHAPVPFDDHSIHQQDPGQHSRSLEANDCIHVATRPELHVQPRRTQILPATADRIDPNLLSTNTPQGSSAMATNDHSRHDWNNSALSAQMGDRHSDTSRTAPNRDAHIQDTSSVFHGLMPPVLQWQCIQDQSSVVSAPMNSAVPSQQPLQEPALQTMTNLTLPSQSLVAGRYDLSAFLFDNDFGEYNYLSPVLSDLLDFGTPRTPMSIAPQGPGDKLDLPDTLFSVDQVVRMRQVWRGRRTVRGIRMIRSLWRIVNQHEADNIFSNLDAPEQDQVDPQLGRTRLSQWGVDDQCRERMSRFCKELDAHAPGEEAISFTPHSTPQSAASDTGSRSSFSLFSADGFPAREVLDASLDLFFQCSHLPFIHKATFDARTVPEALLLAIYLVGLSSLYPERSKPFILHHQKNLMRFCRSDLTARAPGHCQPWELLVAIATTLLVVYLALGYLEDLDQNQAHMLCVQMLHIAEKHGLFAASDGEDPIQHLQEANADPERAWKSWNRAESIKRMICCLLWMDMAYNRLMGGAGVLEIDKVELHLPCTTMLFEAPTSNRFFQATRSQPSTTPTSRIHIQKLYTNPPHTLNHFSVETVLVGLFLQTAAIRHRLPVTHSNVWQRRTANAAEDFSKSGETNDVTASLLLLPSRYPHLFRQRHRVTAFAWNNVCIAVTADLDLLEVASGRDGLECARAATTTVIKWSQTARARRAVLHAAQIFDILSSSRLSEGNIARPDLLLFQSALVLSMYLFVSKHPEEDYDNPAFELLQDIDWIAVGQEGLRSPTQTTPSSPALDGRSAFGSPCTASDFIRRGGPVSFSGELISGGGNTARKILLNYVHLLDDIGKYRESSYSQLLRAMSEFAIEGNH